MVSSPCTEHGSVSLAQASCAASLERRCRDDRKCIPRNIDTRHEGMELQRGCPGKVNTTLSFRVILFSLARNHILLSTSISHVSAKMILPSNSFPLVLVFPVAHPHPLTPLMCF